MRTLWLICRAAIVAPVLHDDSATPCMTHGGDQSGSFLPAALGPGYQVRLDGKMVESSNNEKGSTGHGGFNF